MSTVTSLGSATSTVAVKVSSYVNHMPNLIYIYNISANTMPHCSRLHIQRTSRKSEQQARNQGMIHASIQHGAFHMQSRWSWTSRRCRYFYRRGFYLPWNGTPQLRDYVISKYNPRLNGSPPPPISLHTPKLRNEAKAVQLWLSSALGPKRLFPRILMASQQTYDNATVAIA